VTGWHRRCFVESTFGKMLSTKRHDCLNYMSFPVATFITTIRFTEQGISKINKTTKRANGFKSAAKKMRVKVKDIFRTLGDFDGAIVLDAHDAETAAAAFLQLDTSGNIHTTTTRAFNAAEMGKILAKLSQ
jgi:uncharacterized protein with GYD domain